MAAAIAPTETEKFVPTHQPTGMCSCGESHDTRSEFETDVDFALWFMPQSLRSPGVDQVVYCLMLERSKLKAAPKSELILAELKGIEFALRKLGITF